MFDVYVCFCFCLCVCAWTNLRIAVGDGPMQATFAGFVAYHHLPLAVIHTHSKYIQYRERESSEREKERERDSDTDGTQTQVHGSHIHKPGQVDSTKPRRVHQSATSYAHTYASSAIRSTGVCMHVCDRVCVCNLYCNIMRTMPVCA
jgi:hypothetical protein